MFTKGKLFVFVLAIIQMVHGRPRMTEEKEKHNDYIPPKTIGNISKSREGRYFYISKNGHLHPGLNETTVAVHAGYFTLIGLGLLSVLNQAAKQSSSKSSPSTTQKPKTTTINPESENIKDSRRKRKKRRRPHIDQYTYTTLPPNLEPYDNVGDDVIILDDNTKDNGEKRKKRRRPHLDKFRPLIPMFKPYDDNGDIIENGSTKNNGEKRKKRRKPHRDQYVTLPTIVEHYDDIEDVDEYEYTENSSERPNKRRKPQIEQYTTLPPIVDIYDADIEIMDEHEIDDYDAEYEEALLQYAKDYEQYLKEYAAWNEKYGDLYKNADSSMMALSSSLDSSYARRRRRKKTRRRKQRYRGFVWFLVIKRPPRPINKSRLNTISYFFIERTCISYLGLGAKFLHNYHDHHHLHHTLL